MTETRWNPFAALGLPTDPDLTDARVREAWRSIAAATHTDRPDGGDRARYSAASRAYRELRTPWGRSEAYADLTGPQDRPPPRAAPLPPRPEAPAPTVRKAARAGLTQWRARIRHGRPLYLAGRVLVAAVVAMTALAVLGTTPAGPAVVVGAATWLLLTARGDLAPPPGH